VEKKAHLGKKKTPTTIGQGAQGQPTPDAWSFSDVVRRAAG
jgi:hypothetical protein